MARVSLRELLASDELFQRMEYRYNMGLPQSPEDQAAFDRLADDEREWLHERDLDVYECVTKETA